MLRTVRSGRTVELLGRSTLALRVDPDAIDSELLRGGHVPLEVIANHPCLGSRLPQTCKREFIHTRVRLPEAEFPLDQNGIEDRLQTEPLDLHARCLRLQTRYSTRDRRRSTSVPYSPNRPEWCRRDRTERLSE